jgi:hypothetical protein
MNALLRRLARLERSRSSFSGYVFADNASPDETEAAIGRLVSSGVPRDQISLIEWIYPGPPGGITGVPIHTSVRE